MEAAVSLEWSKQQKKGFFYTQNHKNAWNLFYRKELFSFFFLGSFIMFVRVCNKGIFGINIKYFQMENWLFPTNEK